MASKVLLACLGALLGEHALATRELTEKDFTGALEGKNAFVKFLAPW
jgi:hypothetical protein